MARRMIGYLCVKNLQIIDVAANSLAEVVANTKNYSLRICVQNTNMDDTYWYDNIQLRVVPVGINIQFYKDDSFSAKRDPNRLDSALFRLRSRQLKWYSIPFRWTGTSVRNAALLKFDTGVYAHTLPIRNGWAKLSHPI